MLSHYMYHTFQETPRFYEVSVHNEGNQKVFTYSVKDKAGVVLGKAKGSSKKEAENNAAKEALSYYGQPVCS